MASSTKASTGAAERRVEADLAPRRRDAAALVRPERLPVSELAYDRAGAGSPFGDDVRFPLPMSELTYVHPTPDAAPAHH